MSIYRQKSSSGRSKRFTAEFVYAGKRYRRGGFPDRETAKFWVDSESLKLRRGAVGYIKPMLKAKVLPLVEQFIFSLRNKGRDTEYCYTTLKRLTRLTNDCGWQLLGDVTQASLEHWMQTAQKWRSRVLVAKTKNQYLDAAVQFGAWLCDKRQSKLPSNPLDGSIALREIHNDRYRRAGTLDELNKLLGVAAKPRRICYIFRIYSPMRSGTVKKLTWRMMHLDAEWPFATTPDVINKSGRDEKHPIRLDVAQQLRAMRGIAKADDLVFPNAPTLDDLKTDLKAAGIPFCDSAKLRRLDLHSFRKTLVRLAKDSGLSIDQASLILQHRDIRTTRKHYDDDLVEPNLAAAIERLPAIGQLRRAQ